MRHLSTLAFAALVGSLFLVGDASACHKKKAAACPCPAPAPVVCAPAPAPAPVVCAAPAPAKKCHFKMPKIKMGHKKAACETVYAPIEYSAPASYATPQTYPTAQATGQGM